jgi:hypothetical protein
MSEVSILLDKWGWYFPAHVDYSVGERPSSVVAADFNGYGTLDLALRNQGPNTASVLLANCDTLDPPPRPAGPALEVALRASVVMARGQECLLACYL